jgi:hypothetical protein
VGRDMLCVAEMDELLDCSAVPLER